MQIDILETVVTDMYTVWEGSILGCCCFSSQFYILSWKLNGTGHLRPEKAMATHSSTLAWRIPGVVEPGGLPSMGSHRVRHY